MHASMTEQLADRAVERTVAGRRAVYEAEMQRIVECTFALIQRTGSLDPSMRDILAEADLSTQAFYRYFSSKDQLMLVLLDEGRRRLLETLERRMHKEATAAGQVRAWIEGVLSQAANAAAATRTRPWVLSEQRLTELFPEEQQASVDLLVGLLDDAVRQLGGQMARGGQAKARARAEMVYCLVFATLRSHLLAGTRPSAAACDDVVRFCLRGLTGEEAP